jgi:DNA-binding GntR family transcriptional regulator
MEARQLLSAESDVTDVYGTELASTATRSPREHIVRDIIGGLYEGRYVPGQRLVEADLTRQYDASRGPVREALNWLSAHGIVSLTLQRGAQVRRLSKQEALDVLVVVEPLVGLAARLAATHIGTPKAPALLKGALADLLRFDPSSGSPDHAYARDHFYGTLIRIGGNQELRRIMPRVLIHLVRVQYRAALKPVDETRHADYREIVREVLRGRPNAAQRVARTHIVKTLAAVREAQEP